ncbi:MAG: ZIP family metal transporter [Clostridiales bacterium]|nr:ZIP family metal transporter [Clostridiales bacterium]
MLDIISIAYTVSVASFILGIIFSYFTKKIADNFIGALMGFTGGLLLSFICFEILPTAFIACGLYFSIAGILLGVVFSIFVENRFDYTNIHNNKLLKTGTLIGLGMSLHNFPEGMALGSMLRINYNLGIKFSVLIAIHCLPEVLAICIPLRKAGFSSYRLFVYGLLLSLPMAAGALLGGFITSISGALIALSLSFAGGVMLYISCGQIIPESKNFYNSKITTIISCFGFITGILMINYL